MWKVLAEFVLGLLALPVAVMTVARLGLLPVNANTSASNVEASFAHMALDASAARRAPRLPEPHCTHGTGICWLV